MIPYLITPPETLPVSLQEMKAHLRVVHDDDDADIAAKQAGAVALLDGWGGILGRCIMPQKWAIDVTGAGPHLLPFPDATDVIAQIDGDPLSIEQKRTGLGSKVKVSGQAAGQTIEITAIYGMPEHQVAAAATLIKLMVQREFDVMQGAEYDSLTRSIQALITALRWVRI